MGTSEIELILSAVQDTKESLNDRFDRTDDKIDNLRNAQELHSSNIAVLMKESGRHETLLTDHGNKLSELDKVTSTIVAKQASATGWKQILLPATISTVIAIVGFLLKV